MKKRKIALIAAIIILILLIGGFLFVKYLEATSGKKLVISQNEPENGGSRGVTYIFNFSYGKIYLVT